MPQNKSEDMIIKYGDTLINDDSEVRILGYDLESDAYLCDIFNPDGKLIGHAMPIKATIIETCFWKRNRDGMTEAERINKISDWVQSLETAAAVCADKELDLENEKITYIFHDGSEMVFCRTDRWVIDPIPKLLEENTPIKMNAR